MKLKIKLNVLSISSFFLKNKKAKIKCKRKISSLVKSTGTAIKGMKAPKAKIAENINILPRKRDMFLVTNKLTKANTIKLYSPIAIIFRLPQSSTKVNNRNLGSIVATIIF